ncbi:MAG: nitrogen fixation protein NifQ [Gammaproteobacteria bacterium]|nr:nitrogen fixation protein NifQ [Gammaproteobacteria bacterium]
MDRAGAAVEGVRAHLMAHATGAGNDAAFAAMIATRSQGGGALPAFLGLDAAAFRRLLEHHFPGLPAALCRTLPGIPMDCAAGFEQRAEEREELQRLMLMHKAGDSPSEVWMAHVVAAGCMASNHLWEDLGLLERPQLTDLMRHNFPSLAALNVKDMKWKRFLYKQLCEAEGIYICRAPTCEVCADYQACFGPED